MINEYIPKQTYAIVTGYIGDKMTGVVAGAIINNNNSINLSFPVNNPFNNGQKVTLHIDDRTGIEEFTLDLNVSRCSYKAILTNNTKNSGLAIPSEYQLVYKNDAIESYKDSQYDYPIDNRGVKEIPESGINEYIIPNGAENENKLGVWCTRAIERPHTTVMAFLSSKEDDIFIISHKESLKSKFIHKDNRCLFAIDHRSSYHFEKKYDWNYTIIEGEAFLVPRSNQLFTKLQEQFVEKNPWELLFFTNPDVEMFHIKPKKIICPNS